MGLRLVLGITLLSLLVVLGAQAYGGQTWELSGETHEGNAIRFGIGPEGTPDSFEVEVLTDCGELRTWRYELVVPFEEPGDRMRAADSFRNPGTYGSATVEHWRIEAVLTADAISGRVRLDERWTTSPRRNGPACTSDTVTFTVPRD